MKILYDHQVFEEQEFGGISRYFSELIRRNPEARLCLEYSDNIHIRDHPRFEKELRAKDFHVDRFLGGIRFRGKNRIYSYYKRIPGLRPRSNKDASVEALKRGDFDLFHPTYYDPYFLDVLGNRPFVVTIYDMIHEKFPENFWSEDPTGERKKRVALEAALIIAISENTKKDILSAYEIDPGKIRVIYLGSSLRKGAIEGIDLPDNYILFTGMRHGHKNFGFFAATIAELLIAKPDLYLVCTGPQFSREEAALFSNLGIAKKVLHRFAPEAALYSIYSRARCFVFPSYYEGFGIPILEAFEAGCPVLLARASCFPEIAGDAALYFDPREGQELLDSLSELLKSESLRGELIAKGRKRLRDFSWDLTYSRTMDCYREIS
jgi:glycosyltransferase involved in cell wall biosynthesis